MGIPRDDLKEFRNKITPAKPGKTKKRRGPKAAQEMYDTTESLAPDNPAKLENFIDNMLAELRAISGNEQKPS